MATAQCTNCGRDVGTRLIVCPDCGTPVGYQGGTSIRKAAASEADAPLSTESTSRPRYQRPSHNLPTPFPDRESKLQWEPVAGAGAIGVIVSGVLGFILGAAVGTVENIAGIAIAVHSLSVFLAGTVAESLSEENELVYGLVYGLLGGIAVVVFSVPVNLLFGLPYDVFPFGFDLIFGMVLGTLGGAAAHRISS